MRERQAPVQEVRLVVVVGRQVLERRLGHGRCVARVASACAERRGDDAEVQVVERLELGREADRAPPVRRGAGHVPRGVDTVRVDEAIQEIGNGGREVGLLVTHRRRVVDVEQDVGPVDDAGDRGHDEGRRTGEARVALDGARAARADDDRGCQGIRQDNCRRASMHDGHSRPRCRRLCQHVSVPP